MASGMKREAAEILAVVMARGGSVGLPGKSLRMLLGKPVLAYTLEHVRVSKLVTRAVVSSDDPAILAVAGGAGFETLMRPAELATATSATDPVLRHAVRALYPAWHVGNLTTEGTEDHGDAGGGGNEPRMHTDAHGSGIRSSEVVSVSSVPPVVQNNFPYAVVMLYGNVPIRANGMIDRCIEMLVESGADSVQTVAPVGKFHPYWMFDRSEDGRIRKHVPNDVFRRQELPPLYSPTGAVYVMKTSVLMGSEGDHDPHEFLGKDRRGLVVDAEDSVDIDTAKDLYVAEAVLRAGREQQ
jgi:N-acylneuraminate cytidylyltransferase